MTGEDMIIQAVAQLLREAKLSDHSELRKVFWIAGRCEHCGAPTVSDGRLTCRSCGRPIVNRCAAGSQDLGPSAVGQAGLGSRPYPHWITLKEWEERVDISEREERLWFVWDGRRAIVALSVTNADPRPTHVLIPGRPAGT